MTMTMAITIHAHRHRTLPLPAPYTTSHTGPGPARDPATQGARANASLSLIRSARCTAMGLRRGLARSLVTVHRSPVNAMR